MQILENGRFFVHVLKQLVPQLTWAPGHRQPLRCRPAASRLTSGPPGPSGQTGRPWLLKITRRRKRTSSRRRWKKKKMRRGWGGWVGGEKQKKIIYLPILTFTVDTLDFVFTPRHSSFPWTPPVFILPDMTPAVTVAVIGDFLSLTWDRKEKSRPSRAMAKMIRGRGNMEPSRLERSGENNRRLGCWFRANGTKHRGTSQKTAVGFREVKYGTGWGILGDFCCLLAKFLSLNVSNKVQCML